MISVSLFACRKAEVEQDVSETIESQQSENVVPSKSRVVIIDGVKNARDLGGILSQDEIEIKSGLIYRCGEMDNPQGTVITPNGIQTCLEEFKIKTDLDLRRVDEITDTGEVPKFSPLGEDVNYIHNSSTEYYNFLLGKTNEAEIMRVFADWHNYPILFHCKHGADRTGTIALLLEALVGVEEEELIQDYELTGWRDREYQPFQFLLEGLKRKINGNTLQEKVYNVFSVNLGLTDMEISNIYNIMMTDSAIFESDSLKQPVNDSDGKMEFHINLRSSKSVSSVEYDGDEIKYEFNNNTLTLLNVTLVDGIRGQIIFDDGAVLCFGK